MHVVIADDSVLLREGIVQLLTKEGFAVDAAVGTAPELLTSVDQHRPAVAIVDIRMPPTHTDEGLRATQELRANHPALGILLLSQWVHAGRALDLFRGGGGGLGYLLKDRVTDIEDFVEAVQRVARSGSALDPDVVAALMSGGPGPLGGLTEREQQVLALMAEGRSNTAIAERLFLGLKTIESYVNTLFAKLGLAPTPDDNRRVLAVLAYLESR
ncbi:response regulator transcription factor [Kribbella sp. C-35]|uniref:response regulator transcription factor n=1 Tax=Kribbella sp. C-35 TaxID=2789276 RepID=UPI00397A9C0A